MQRENWKPYRLNQLGYVGRGRSRSRPRNNPALYGGAYPLFETGDIKSANLYLSNPKKTYNEKGLAQSKLWNPGTVCITVAANIAETAILKIKACFPDSVVGFVANPEKADARYIKYYIDFIKLQMQNISHGTTQDNLSVEKLLTFDFFTPPLATQRKIGAILSNYDDLIENNTRRIKILEEMAQTIYREWFVEFRFPGHENVKMVESELGLIPQGWKVRGLGDVCKVVPGYAFKSKDWKDTGVGVVKIKNIKSDNTIDIDNKDCVAPDILSPKLDKYQLTNGDFLIAMTGATAGKVGRLRTKTTMMLNQRVAKLDPIKVYRDYIWCRISLEETQAVFYRLADGAAQPNMSGSQIEEHRIVWPPPSVCKHFSSIVGDMLLLSDNLMLRNVNLRKTRDLLLPKLISGELDVSEFNTNTDTIQ